MTRRMPKYPVYIPTKGRWEYSQTAKWFRKHDMPFFLVVEEPEAEEYARRFGDDCILTLPFVDQGLIAARNWIMEHAIESGVDRHWQFDDNIRVFMRMHKGRRLPMVPGVACHIVEEFTDRYTNIGISGFNYKMFVTRRQVYPITVNCHVYSATLINNKIEQRWRIKRNDDTDMCLQVLAAGWCTVLFNSLLVDKLRTMIVPGGNTQDLYQGDGRLRMARDLERLWPKTVTVGRRFGRPQHVVHHSWKDFKQPLIRRDDIDWDNLPEWDEFGMEIVELEEVKSPRLKKYIEQERADGDDGDR